MSRGLIGICLRLVASMLGFSLKEISAIVSALLPESDAPKPAVLCAFRVPWQR
jgi:hypothetical protein